MLTLNIPGDQWQVGVLVSECRLSFGFNLILVTNQIQQVQLITILTCYHPNLKPKGKNNTTSTFSKCQGNLARRAMCRINGKKMNKGRDER